MEILKKVVLDMDERDILKLEIDKLKEAYSDLKDNVTSLSKNVNDLTMKVAITDERVQTIFATLSEIKEGIDRVAKSVDEIRAQPGKAFWAILVTLGGAIVIAAFKLG